MNKKVTLAELLDKIPEPGKAGFHEAILLLAFCCGVYNFTKKRKRPWNKFLIGFYVVVMGVEAVCTCDHFSRDAVGRKK